MSAQVLVERTQLSVSDLCALWTHLSGDDDTPEKFELTEHGEIVVSPRATNRHQVVISIVAEQIKQQLGSHVLYEIAIVTSAGVRVPDLAWLPPVRRNEALSDAPLQRCPPIVVEVLSPGNRAASIAHKVEAYLAAGAQEVVLIDTRGAVTYRRAEGEFLESNSGLLLELDADLFGG